MKDGDVNRIVVVGHAPSGVYYTEDEGLTWEMAEGLEAPRKWGGFQKAIVCNDEYETIYLLGNEWDYDVWKNTAVIYKSTDKGKTFELFYREQSSLSPMDIWTHKYGDGNWYRINYDTVFVYDSQGNALDTNVADNPDFAEYQSKLSGTMLDGSYKDGKTYLGVRFNNFKTNSGSIFFVSTNKGESWIEAGEVDFGPFMGNSFSMALEDPSVLYLGGVNCFRTYDGGFDWEAINFWGEYYANPDSKLHADICGIETFRSPEGYEVVIICTDGGLYISYDDLFTVENLSMEGLNVSQYYDVYTGVKESYDINGNLIKTYTLFAGAQDQGYQRCVGDTGGVLSFKQEISGDYGHIVSSDDGETVWMNYPGFTQVYENAMGNHKRRTWNFKNAGSGWYWIAPMIADPEDPYGAYIYSGGSEDNSSNIWRLSLDTGKVSAFEYDYNFREHAGDRISGLSISPIDKNHFYAITGNGKFLHSSNKALDWDLKEFNSDLGANYLYGASVQASAKDFGTVYFAGSGYSNPGAYVTYDHGTTITPIDSGLPSTHVYDIALTDDERFVFAATDVGPYIFDVEEGVWFDLAGEQAPDQTYWSVEYIPELKTARFGTYGRGIWDFQILDIINSVEPPTFAAPKFDVRVYPNPVSNKATISFKSRRSVFASVKIYDLSGNIIADIFEGEIPAGENFFEWTPSQKLSKGSYMCVVSADGNASYAKIILSE